MLMYVLYKLLLNDENKEMPLLLMWVNNGIDTFTLAGYDG